MFVSGVWYVCMSENWEAITKYLHTCVCMMHCAQAHLCSSSVNTVKLRILFRNNLRGKRQISRNMCSSMSCNMRMRWYHVAYINIHRDCVKSYLEICHHANVLSADTYMATKSIFKSRHKWVNKMQYICFATTINPAAVQLTP